jgi:hypothetical protein
VIDRERPRRLVDGLVGVERAAGCGPGCVGLAGVENPVVKDR